MSEIAIGLRYFSDSLQELPAFLDPTTASVPVKAERIKAMRPDVAMAYNALAKLAGHDRVDEVIQPPEDESDGS